MRKIAPLSHTHTHLWAAEHDKIFEIPIPVLDQVATGNLPQDVAHDGQHLQVYFASIEATPGSVLLAALGRAEDRRDEREGDGC